MREPLFVFIVVNYNGERRLSYCLPTLRRMRYSNHKTVVVDNGSTDGSITLLKKCFPEVAIIETHKNLGWTGGNNLGIEYAKRLRAEFVVLLNNDTKVDPDFLKAIASFASKHPRAGMFAGKYYRMGTRTLQVAGGGFFTKEEKCGKNFIGKNEKDEGQHDQARKVDYVYEAALVASSNLFERIGLIDPSWQFLFEGPDLGKRAAKFGIESWYVPEASVEHEIGATFDRKKTPVKTVTHFARALAMAKNRFRFLIKHYPLSEALATQARYTLRAIAEIPRTPYLPFFETYSIAWNLLHLPWTLTLKNSKRENYDDAYIKLLDECDITES
jgi:hypothetical protein